MTQWSVMRLVARVLYSLRREPLALLFPALLGPSQLLLFGPFATYSANQAEFAAPFWSLAAPWIWALAAVTVALVVIGLLLPEWLAVRYQALLFALGLLIWLQGNLLVADYGLLYGEALDLGRHAWRAPYEAALWATAAILAVWFARSISTVASFASQLLLALQAIALAVSVVSAQQADQAGGDDHDAWKTPPEALYRLSADRNVIHIVLDGFLSEVAADLLEADRAAFDRAFPGFIFFADHLGAFPTTRASMPAMMTGVAYRNEAPFKEFEGRIRDRSLFHALAGGGYRIDSASGHSLDHPPDSVPGAISRYTIPTPYGSYRDYVEFASAQLLDLSLFRHAPHALKPRIYNDQAWLAQRWYADRRPPDLAARSERPFNHAAFLGEFARRLTVTENAPVYKFIHAMIPHPPVVVDADCSFVGRRGTIRRRYAAQARCALTVIERVLDRLRRLDVYDRSAIVVTSDHGWQVRRSRHPLGGVRTPVGNLDKVAVSARPILLVKPPGGTGPLQISYAPTTMTDIPATVLDLAGLPSASFPGMPALRVDPETRRERTFAFHTWQNADWGRPYFDALHIFSVTGPSSEPGARRFRKTIFEPVDDLETRLNEYEAGWYPPEHGPDGSFRWGDVQTVTYAPPDGRGFSIAVRRAPDVTFPQTLRVRVDGDVIARRELTDSAWHTFRFDLPAAGRDPNPFCVELLVDPSWQEGERRLGLMYRNLEWTR